MVVPDTNRSKHIYKFLEDAKLKGVIIDWSGGYTLDGEDQMVLVRIIMNVLIQKDNVKSVKDFLAVQSDALKGSILNYSLKKISFRDMMNERDEEEVEGEE